MSINVSSSDWNLRTVGGIKYKLLEGFPTGSFEDETGSIEEQYLIRANQLNAFINESFPSVGVFGGYWLFNGKRVCPHHNRMFTKRVTFEPFPKDKPADPYNVYGGLNNPAYTQNVKVTISYSVDKDQDSDDNDNETFLTVTADTGGEWLVVDAGELALWGSGANLPGGTVVEEFQMPATQLVPKTQWNVKWPKFPNTILSDVIERCRESFGKVNSKTMPLFQDAIKETILFTGFSYSQEWSWREEGPSVSMNMTFDEKFIEAADVFGENVTHQHVYRPGKGFQELLMVDDDGVGQNLYKNSDLNKLFK